MDAALRQRLIEIAGDAAVDARSGVVSPGDAEEVARVCAACSEAGARIAVSSAAAPRKAAADGAAVTISLARLDQVTVEPERLVVRAGAGARLSAVRDAAAKARLALVGVPAGVPGEATVGEVVARGLAARRALGGVEAVLPDGGRVHSGGSMLKDVAGYDLAATLLGSLGRLALVTSASLRLQPAGVAQVAAEPAGVPASSALGEALQLAFDPRRLLVGLAG